MVEAVIFDMDGLLIDSEIFWTQAEIEIFGQVDIALDVEQCRQTVGMGLEEVVSYRYRQKPWDQPSQEDVINAIHRRVVELVAERGQALPGALSAVAFARQQGVRLGLATASDQSLIDVTLDRLALCNAFDHIQSASGLALGKPHPEVYLLCAKQLGVSAQRCVAIEDSLPGLIAAKAARMKAIAVPDPVLAANPGFGLADVCLESLEQFDETVWQKLT